MRTKRAKPGSMRHLETLSVRIATSDRPRFSEVDRDVLCGVIRLAQYLRRRHKLNAEAAKKAGYEIDLEGLA